VTGGANVVEKLINASCSTFQHIGSKPGQLERLEVIDSPLGDQIPRRRLM